MLDVQKKRIQLLLLIVGIIALSITAEKCRHLVGEEASSKSGQFTFLNCFDMSSGTAACAVKEGVKLYFYNIRASHVERARHSAIGTALEDALNQKLSAKDAAKMAQKEGEKAAKLATRQAKRIIGPIISSGWDFFEAVYYGGTVTEGFLRGTGTLFGAYAGGFYGEQSLGRFGYLVGSHLGSWVGGRIGLMVYDVVNGVHFLLEFVQPESEGTERTESPTFEHSEDNYPVESPTYESSESYEEPSPTYESSESYEEPSPAYESSESYEEPPAYENSESYEESSPAYESSESYEEPPAYESSESYEEAPPTYESSESYEEL